MVMNLLMICKLGVRTRKFNRGKLMVAAVVVRAALIFDLTTSFWLNYRIGPGSLAPLSPILNLHRMAVRLACRQSLSRAGRLQKQRMLNSVGFLLSVPRSIVRTLPRQPLSLLPVQKCYLLVGNSPRLIINVPFPSLRFLGNRPVLRSPPVMAVRNSGTEFIVQVGALGNRPRLQTTAWCNGLIRQVLSGNLTGLLCPFSLLLAKKSIGLLIGPNVALSTLLPKSCG